MILPLPNFFSSSDAVSAANYFAGPGRRHVQEAPRLGQLLQKRQTPGQALTAGENAELVTFHTEFFNLDLAEKGGLGLSETGETLTAGDLNALITIRQWQRGTDPNPPVIQRVAGSLIEIGIDYAVNVPGAFDQDSNHGKAIAGYLRGLQEINFSETQLRDLPTRLFVATLDTLSQESGLLSGDPKVQELITVTTKSLSTDVARRLAQHTDDLTAQERVADWADLIFRSVLSSAGPLVIADPKRFLGVDQSGEIAAVTRVGDAVLGLVLDQPDMRLDRVFGREGLNTVVKAALAAIGEHPEILHVNQSGLQKLLSEVATQLARYDTVVTPDILPELARLVLDKTGENLALLWPGLANDPAKNLALTAARTTLDILTQVPPPGARWSPRFSRDDLLAVCEASLGELVANPGWLITKSGDVNDNLKVALEAALGVLRARGDRRLSPAVGVDVLRAAVEAVARRKEFLDRMPGGEPLVAAALDAMLSTIFGSQARAEVQWRLVQSEAIRSVVHIGLDQLARAQLRPELVSRLQAVLDAQVKLISDGKSWDANTFEAALNAALQAA
ncbi:MAG TPA: hypothetical protein VLM91_16935 [Candidatus Methylomirabilis sp.]|nr:hypothetical protein [Candidatus Methylomirabilis sp.]